jgi:lipid II:glycine glycyltransferase (peptidoglycan interpeptide bridge formation enzyme)
METKEKMTMYQVISKNDKTQVAAMAQFINSHENGHFLQSPQWAQVKKGWRWRGVLAYDEAGQLAGATSVLIRPLPLGLSILYAPRGPVCDRGDAAIVNALLAGVDEIAGHFHALLFLLDPDVPDEDQDFRALMARAGFAEQTSAALDNIQAQYVMRLPLAGRTEKDVFSGFCSKTRYNVRVALRHGVQLRQFSGREVIPDEAIQAFAKLMKTTGERDHFLTRSPEYFRTILSRLGEDAVLFLAYLDDKPIAGTIGVFQGRKAWYLYGASANDHRDAMPNYLLQWEMIRRAIALGCTFYDLRGVPGDPTPDDPLYGLYRFKKGFSGEYTKFSGLYIRKYKKLLGGAFWAAYKAYRWLQRRGAQEHSQPRPCPPSQQPQLLKNNG